MAIICFKFDESDKSKIWRGQWPKENKHKEYQNKTHNQIAENESENFREDIATVTESKRVVVEKEEGKGGREVIGCQESGGGPFCVWIEDTVT